ncbi:MAG: response regulator [Chloroflexi bacterium]|nr:response regulator [Chloroflexota bacterium]
MKSHVLVVEDDEQLRRIITSNLVARGHQVRQAPDATSAIAAISDAQPDLLILDVNLPDRTGWDVLRESELGEDVRVLMLTAVPVSPRRLAEFRPVGYLPKPFPLEALLRLAESSSRTVTDDA